MPKSFLTTRDKKTSWLLKPRKGGKTLWDWLGLLIVPALITTIAGVFTLITVSQQNEISQQQNEIFKQRDDSENNRNQKALLNEYVTAIARLVEQKLLTLEENSKSQRDVSRARTFSILRALDGDRKGELLQFLSTAKLIEAENYKSIISLFGADLQGANLKGAALSKTNLRGVNFIKAELIEATFTKAELNYADFTEAKLIGAFFKQADFKGAYLRGTHLQGAYLKETDFRVADFEGADLTGAYLKGANFGTDDYGKALNLTPTQVKSACNWEEAEYSEKFKEELAQAPKQQVDCSYWDEFLGIK